MKLGVKIAGALLVVGLLLAVPILGIGGVAIVAASVAGVSSSSSSSLNTSAVPAEYVDVVIRAGSICSEITPSLIAAQIERESGWRKDALSEASAQGIAQFLPSTWSESGKDGDGDGVADINNPFDQIISQGHYMCAKIAEVKQYLDNGSASGDVISLALAAYNAGSGKVLEFHGVPPFEETQEYIRDIKQWAATKYAIVAPTGGAGRERIIEAAQKYLGLPYIYGGNDPVTGIDCSRFVQLVFQDLGVVLPRSADAQANSGLGQSIPPNLDQMQPGDVVAFRYPGAGTFHHVAIYAGGGQVIHASWYGTPLGYAPIDQSLEWRVLRIPLPGGDSNTSASAGPSGTIASSGGISSAQARATSASSFSWTVALSRRERAMAS